jgi:hypothetical protein
MKNEPFNIYMFFKEGIELEKINTEITLTCFDSKLNSNLNFTVKISSAQPNNLSVLDNDHAFKMGVFRVIQTLQYQIKQ